MKKFFPMMLSGCIAFMLNARAIITIDGPFCVRVYSYSHIVGAHSKYGAIPSNPHTWLKTIPSDTDLQGILNVQATTVYENN